MLSVRSVTKRYGQTIVLDAVSLELGNGNVLASVGSNGAGKSTLIKAIVGLLRYDGEIQVDGVDARRHGPDARRRIGYVPQAPAFHLDLTVRETLTFYARLRGVGEQDAREAGDAVGLSEQSEKLVGALSGGMRQRLALGIAQLGDPPLLVLDEPSSGLDISARLELRRFIQEQRRTGRAVLFSTHWMEDIATVADTVLVLDGGRTTFLGPAAEFAAKSAPSSRMFMRVNGRSQEAVTLLERVAPGGIARTGEWIVVTCAAREKGRVLEALFAGGITILDVRVDDAAPADAASAQSRPHLTKEPHTWPEF